MTLNTKHLELFSKAFVRAIAAAAGCTVQDHSENDLGIDLSVTGYIRSETGGRVPREIYIQVKSTSQHVIQDDKICYPLEVKNYNDLRSTDIALPFILVLVLIPPERNDWLTISPEQLLMKHCAYWCSLAGEPSTENTSTITIEIPLANKFDIRKLKELLVGNPEVVLL